mmetsp:Transcript_35206/g.31668  ORF Transcript_35206/g.31668 Transcript_35206/m.31668 type:complete len:156 (-) Transcript_35206:200-667(-)
MGLRKKGDSRTNNNCGGDEAYFFERVHDFGGLVDGTYTIFNNKWSKYLTNNNGDQLSGEETPRNWIVTNEGDGVFSIQDEQSLNYLRCGNQGEINAVPHSLSWERWYLEEQDDGSYCIVNRQFNKYVRMYKQSGNYKVNQQGYCGSWERYTLQRV